MNLLQQIDPEADDDCGEGDDDDDCGEGDDDDDCGEGDDDDATVRWTGSPREPITRLRRFRSFMQVQKPHLSLISNFMGLL